MRVIRLLMSLALLTLTGCGAVFGSNGCTALSVAGAGSGSVRLGPPASALPILGVSARAVATFAAPWAMTFLPDGRLLVTERPSFDGAPGRIAIVTQDGRVSAPIAGLPRNEGMLDVVLHPRFAQNRLVYVSFMEAGQPGEERYGRGSLDPALHPVGMAVAVGRLSFDRRGGGRLTTARVIWRQFPKIVSEPGRGEPGGKMAFSPDGRYLFVSSGDRQEFEPAQVLDNSMGKIVRLNTDGSIPEDNPFVGQRGALPEIWSYGHRNPYGLVFDVDGRLWSHEMGPDGGDELNLIRPCGNYGWPRASNGDHYSGTRLTRHRRGDGFVRPALSWTPVIAPSGMIIYSGSAFPAWRGSAIITGLQSMGLVRVRLNDIDAVEEQRIDLGARIREVEQAPDGAIWVLEDAPTGRLVKLLPAT